jgi:tetratricopeptide (TPR) repeat protein
MLNPKKLSTNAFLKFNLILFMLVSLLNQGCITLNNSQSAYINNDPTDIYSTHPSRPFKYGYAYTKEQCKENFENYLADYKFKKGDVIADIGAASGWMDAAFSVLVDSLTFYSEDIDTIFLNKSEFDKVINYYNTVRETPQTNKFNFVIGTQRKTNLPDTLFDKIIFNNSFHEISNVSAILEDVCKKLKPEGQIMIREKFSNRYKDNHIKGCGYKGYKVSYVVSLLESEGFHLTNMTKPESSFSNHLTFEKDEAKAIEFQRKIESVEPYVTELYKLYQKNISKDSINTIKVAHILKVHLKEICEIYSSLEDDINILGYEWLKEKEYQTAINIFKVNTILYPSSSNVYDSMGEAYMLNGQYDIALTNYCKSVKLNPENINGKEKIQKIKELQTKLK